MRLLRIRRPSPAMVVAMLALLVAMSSSAGADPVGEISALIRGNKIARNAITTKHVKNRTLRAADFARGQLRSGPAGPQGPTGAQGPRGPAGASAARHWAGIESDGSVSRQSGGITSRFETNNDSYEVTFPRDVSGCSYSVNGGDMAAIPSVAVVFATVAVAARSANSPRTVMVNLWDNNSDTIIADDFFIAVHC